MIKVIFINEHKFKNIPQKKEFQTWVNTVVENIPEKIPTHANEIVINIVDSQTSAHLNETFRHKKGPTNVLSFTYDAIESDSVGDLAICAALVEEEAHAQNKPLIAHWAHLTIHGFLHLLGYDHIVEDEAIAMETLETQLLTTLGFDNPY